MAQHDFAPAWLNFPAAPPSSKNSLNSEKHTEGLLRPDSHYSVARRRHNSSEAFDSAVGRSNGNFGRKENGWRLQGRNGSECVNQGGTFNGGGSRSRGSVFTGGKSREGSSLENDALRKDGRDRRKQFEAEDFPFLNPEHGKEVNQNKSVSTGVWEYPLNTKSRSSRMLVIRKGMKDDFSLSGYPVTTSTRIPLSNATDLSKGLVSEETSPVKELSNVHLDENKIAISSSETFRPNKALHMDLIDSSQPSVKEEVESSIFSNGKSTCHARDINLNFDQSEIPPENRNTFTSGQITRSSTFPQEVVLSSSLEAEHRLLKEMGWQEDSENDDIYAPLTEDEMREFHAISEQLRKTGLRKNGLLKNVLSLEFKFDPWRHGTFTDENEDTETSSSDTSDDDDL